VIKVIASGVWVCLVTLAASYAAVSWKASHRAPDSEPDKKVTGAVEYIKPRQISVPIIVDGALQGYVVAQFVFTLNAHVLKRLSVETQAFLHDEAFRAIYAGEAIDFRRLKKQDLSALSKKIAENVNKRFEADLVREVLIQELSYVPKDQVRGGPRRT
jgi:hypothetical protein